MKSLATLQHMILDIRGHKVILDRDVAVAWQMPQVEKVIEYANKLRLVLQISD